jgi:hypothetical protein
LNVPFLMLGRRPAAGDVLDERQHAPKAGAFNRDAVKLRTELGTFGSRPVGTDWALTFRDTVIENFLALGSRDHWSPIELEGQSAALPLRCRPK